MLIPQEEHGSHFLVRRRSRPPSRRGLEEVRKLPRSTFLRDGIRQRTRSPIVTCMSVSPVPEMVPITFLGSSG